MSAKDLELLLVQGLQSGDPEARQEFFTRAHDAVFAYTCRLTQDYDLRCDWTQDCLLKLTDEIATGKFQYQRPGSLWAWFRVRSRFLILDYLRTYQRQSERKADIELSILPPAADNPEDDLQQTEVVSIVEKCIDGNPNTTQQHALHLLLFRGLTYDVIAEITKRPLNTIRADIRRGRIALRNCLIKQLGLPEVEE